jgi:hypothetical protein
MFMKKNAILVAGILFVAGCAHERGGYATASVGQGYGTMDNTYARVSGPEVIDRDADGRVVASSSTRSTSPTSQYASSGGFATTDNIRADSSIRGGSNEARGYTQSSQSSQEAQANLGSRVEATPQSPTEPQAINPEAQADSSIRGGSLEARQAQAGATADSDLAQGGFDAVITGQANSSRSSENNLDDIDVPPESQLDMNASASDGHHAELNSSGKLNKDLSGNYQVPADQMENGSQSAANASDQSAMGSSATSESGSSSSASLQNNSDAQLQSGALQSGNVSRNYPNRQSTSDMEQNWMFHNNRAQGVGSAATGRTGADQGALEGNENQSLASKVKSVLTKESTGTEGMLRKEISRNIKVTADGSNITLKGSVPSQQDKDIVGIRAAQVDGVTRVDNQLTVSPRSDSNIRDLGKGHDLEDNLDQVDQ